MSKPQKFVPAYKQVAAYVRELIMSGELKEGDKIPAMAALAKEFGIQPETVRSGIKVLLDEGLVKAVWRRGTYVEPRSMWKINQDNNP